MSRPVPVLKDEGHECAVPSIWRPKLREIVEAFRSKNYTLVGIQDVETLDSETSLGISQNIEEYGQILAPLPDSTWDTSIYSWQVDYWEVLVDLFTIPDGLSDLVVHVFVYERAEGFIFKVHFVYVP